MKWTVLSDNRRCDDSLETEHGLSILLETKKHRILLDTGASDVFIRNAAKMNIDLGMVNYVFISHGHSDHAGGLKHFMEINDKAAIKREQARTKFKVIVSPNAMSDILTACPWPVHTVVGGFHLLDGQETENELVALAQKLKIKYPNTQFYTSHCTGDKVFATLKTIMGNRLHAFSCGTTITI